MEIDIIPVPYDSGQRGVRMGAGPIRLLEGGLADRLARSGHDVRLVPAELLAPFGTEVAAVFELARVVRGCVSASLERGALPLLLAGNCSHSLGAIAALGDPHVFWFDAHGDLNTPDTTLSGLLDGMALSIALGRCWNRLSADAGLTPLAEERVWLLGARDLDPGEHGFLARAAVHTSLESLPRTPTDRPAHLHVDLDVLDPGVASVNQYAVPGGLSLEELLGAIGLIARTHRIASATLSAYDPAVDPEGRVVSAAFVLCEHLVALAAARQP